MSKFRDPHAFEQDGGSRLCKCGLPEAMPLHQRPGDQPLPTQHDGPIVQELVLADIQERLEIGIERYGTGLQAHNGRDMLRDAYEEALDLAIYLRGCLLERDDRT